jgi:hypothetical protein
MSNRFLSRKKCTSRWAVVVMGGDDNLGISDIG